jgi:probable phosphoglycerate mutase
MAEFIYLARHGTTQPNVEKRFIGTSNPPLNEMGFEQAHALSKTFPELNPEKVYCSPQLRAVQTAMGAMPGIGDALSVLEDLREADFGEWENLTEEEIMERDPKGFAMMRANHEDFSFPGGEALRDFIVRVERVADTLKGDPARSVVAFTHGGVIRYLACRLLGEGYERVGERYLPPCGVAVLERNGSVYRVTGLSGGWRWES